jgi:hypothetical protein
LQNAPPGIVLSYDPTFATYLIEFEDEIYGYEYCPDTDVASYGTPIVSSHKFIHNFHDEFDKRIGRLQGRFPLVVLLLSPSFIS